MLALRAGHLAADADPGPPLLPRRVEPRAGGGADGIVLPRRGVSPAGRYRRHRPSIDPALPAQFRKFQWKSLPGGEPTRDFVDPVKQLYRNRQLATDRGGMSVGEAALADPSGGATVDADNPWPGLLAFRETDAGLFPGTPQRNRGTVPARDARAARPSCSACPAWASHRCCRPASSRGCGGSRFFRCISGWTSHPSGRTWWRRSARRSRRRRRPTRSKCRRHPATRRCGSTSTATAINFWNTRNRPVMPLLVFDQFEEIFTLGRLDPSRAEAPSALADQLADLAECRPPAALKAWIDEHPDEAADFSVRPSPLQDSAGNSRGLPARPGSPPAAHAVGRAHIACDCGA